MGGRHDSGRRRRVAADDGRRTFDVFGTNLRRHRGTILDDHDVTCGVTHHHIIVDMYHPGYLEERAVPGFSSRPLRKM
jgi:hypothetical protein